VIKATPLPHYRWERTPVPIVEEVVWAAGLVWTVTENVAPTGFRTLDRPARIESPCRLHEWLDNCKDLVGLGMEGSGYGLIRGFIPVCDRGKQRKSVVRIPDFRV
jgi:hypothetical protein